MRVLITGAGGQLGRALQEAFRSDDVFPYDHAALDVTDAGAVRRAMGEARPEVAVHAAAWTDTAGCEKDPQRAMAVNAGGSAVVAGACHSAGAAMVYISTNEVFDGTKATPYVEDDEPLPINGYGQSKLEGERRVQAVLDRVIIVRTSWLYGPGRVSFPEKILQAAKERGRLRLVTDEVASPTWTVDLAPAISRLVRKPASGIYHLANGGQCSRLEWAREVLRLAGLDSVTMEPTVQAEFGGPYRKPALSTLANVRAAALGIELRPWPAALRDHFRLAGSPDAAAGRARVTG